MKILGILLLGVFIVTVSARHKKEWVKVDLNKLAWERPVVFYKSEKPACSKGSGFYRDPQDCHKFIRCVDEYGNGRQFSVFVGRCDPGLVFDENVSACNWPELAAPCSNSPPRLQEVRKPLQPERTPEDNSISGENNRNKPYPDGQQVFPESQAEESYNPQQQVPVIQEVQIVDQQPTYEEKTQQILTDTQNSGTPIENQPQEQVYQENDQKHEIQEQVNQENIENSAVEEQQLENTQVIKKEQNEQNIVQLEQASYQEQNDEIFNDVRPEQVSSSDFQQIIDQETQSFDMPQQAQLDEFPQQQSQIKWWIPENHQNNHPESSKHIRETEPDQQPMFCSQEGFYRHPQNCSQFIRCVLIGNGAFAVHLFECPYSLVFSERDSSCVVNDLNSCISNTRTKRQASDSKLKCKGEGFFRHPKDCRAFYRCVKSETGYYETHHFSCPANLVFDEEYTTCNWPEKAPPCDSQQTYKPTRKPVKPAQTERTTYKPPSRTSSRGPSYDTNRRSTTKPPRNDFIDKSITQEIYNKRRSTGRPKSTTQSYDSGFKCRNTGFYGSDNDCSKFFKCVRKGNRFIRYDLACPKNFAYDDVSKKCIPQRYASTCNRNKPYPPRQDDEETTRSPEATSSSSSSSGSGNDASACKQEGYFRNPEDCNKFYRCVDFDGKGEEFVRYDFNCPEGLVFDEENSVCNWPDQSAPCDTRGGDGGQDTGKDGDVDDGGMDDNENDGRETEDEENKTSTSAQPSSTETVEASSPPPDDGSESGSNESGDSGSEKESGGAGSENECTKEGFYRNPEDCNKFYRCVDFDGEGKEFVRYDFNCPEGLVFDEANSVCNWPADSEPCDTRSGGGNEGGTGQDGTSSTSSPGRDGESSEGNQTPSERDQTTPSGNESSENTPESGSSSVANEDNPQSSTESSNEGGTGSNGENSGECTEEGFFRNPDDCNKFYRCVDQNNNGEYVKYDFTCPEGLVFDEANSVCNWPDQSAPCDGGSSDREKSSTSGTGDDGSESSQTTSSGSRSSSEGTTESASSSTTERSQSTDTDDTGSTTERSTNTPSENDGQESTSDTSGGESGGNQGECTEEGFYRNPEDCNKFYRCVDFNGDGQQFVRYDFECPEGLVFDEVNSVCNWPDQSPKCETRSDSDGNQTTDSSSGSSTSQTESSSEQSQSSTEESTQSSANEPTQGSTQSATERSTSESSTTSSSEGSSECTEPGFYRCKDDCNKFYRCVDEDGKLVRYDFKCPDGLIFDDKNKKCDWPSSELTCEQDSSGSTTASSESSTQSSSTSSESSKDECKEEGFFRDSNDCRKYYRCIDEGDGTFTREDYSCAEDEVFDEEMRYCNRKDLAPPPCGESQTTTAGGTSSESQGTTEKSTTTAKPSTESSTKSSSSSECIRPGFFRCPEDCTKFYRCVEEGENNENLVRYDFQCPDGLIFDESKEKCDWPSSELTCDTQSTSSSDSSTSGSQTSGTTPQDSPSSGTSSSNGCTEEGFFRNPDDCSKYYRCTDEGDGTLKREDFACEEDEVFDEEMRYCNRKDLAPPCDGTSSTTESSTRSQTTESTSSSEDAGSSSTSGSSGSGECEEEGFHRDPNDCSKFYRCVDFEGDGKSFTRYDFDCPEGLVFDESNDVCNWPSSVPSCESDSGSRGSTKGDSSTESSSQASSGTSESSTTSSESEQSSTTSTDQASTTSRDSGSTSSTEEQSPAAENEPSTASESGTTSSGETSSRGGGSSSDIECTEEGFFRHPDDCNKFYRCVDFAGTGESYVRYDFDCPEGLHFDEVNSVCNWPSMSPSCESGSGSKSNNESESKNEADTTSTKSEGTTQSSSDSSSDSSRTTSNSDSSTTSRDQTTQSSSTSSSGGEFRCEEEGFFSNPNDCKKYYECKRDEETGELVKTDCECPDGQVWDKEGWYCNDAELSPSCNSDSSSSSFECKEEGFFRDPEDCTKYYQCNKTGPGENDFSKEHHQCDDGLVFDESGRYCNAPELSEPCDESSSTSKGTTGEESPGGSTGDGSSGQGECTKEGFFRNPEDCTKYYQCSRNEETGGFDRSDYSCPDGRIFDEGSSYCNDPELSEEPCDSGSSSESTTSQQTTSGTSSSGGGSTSSGTRSGGNPECTQEGFFRHPDDCNKFYRCVDFSGSGESFVRYDFDCPEGLHFDEVNSVCNWPTMTPPCESSNRLFLFNRAE